MRILLVLFLASTLYAQQKTDYVALDKELRGLMAKPNPTAKDKAREDVILKQFAAPQQAKYDTALKSERSREKAKHEQDHADSCAKHPGVCK
jgi:hypothetical protein